ncbi:MAG: SUF system NifU family Fe-S cluster assembly protein [Bifidobacteriaceae bacterium]|jgi:nitrogen fixation NifU-like protein|nr:SUF system NifU family Fe-S cluster assembly protein [Bifidobacteriaceae bacterium]
MNELDSLYGETILTYAQNPSGKVAANTDAYNELKACSNGSTNGCSSSKSGTKTGGKGSDGGTNPADKNATNPGVCSHQFNPTCGDEITLRAIINDDIIQEIEWIGEGCSISLASASVLTDLITGRTTTDAMDLIKLFLSLMNSKGEGVDAESEEKLEDAAIFQSVSTFPMRIKCALISWMALKDSILNN